ncbi:MAG: energy transducer TonB [Terriglobales bacterium]
MPFIRILADPEDETIPPPPPKLPGGEFATADLLLDLREEHKRTKRREAIYLSIIAHLLLCVFILVLLPKIFQPVTIPENAEQQQPLQLTYLALPPDLITKAKPTHPKALSDRNRHFQHQDKILSSISAPVNRPAPRPRAAQPPPGPRSNARPAPPRSAAVAAAPPAPKPAPTSAGTAGGKPAPETGQLELENIPQPKVQPRLKLDVGPTTMLEQAIQGAVRDGARGQQGVTEVAPLPQPPAGSGSHAPGQTGAGVEILSDTEGVDFSSYLREVVEIVRRNWYAVMPVTVYLGTQGRVVIIFNINANGSVPGIHPVSFSGHAPLDHAAEAAINASNPFPPLPSAFHGPYITLQFSFYYNLTPPGK